MPTPTSPIQTHHISIWDIIASYAPATTSTPIQPHPSPSPIPAPFVAVRFPRDSALLRQKVAEGVGRRNWEREDEEEDDGGDSYPPPPAWSAPRRDSGAEGWGVEKSERFPREVPPEPVEMKKGDVWLRLNDMEVARIAKEYEEEEGRKAPGWGAKEVAVVGAQAAATRRFP